MEITFFEWERLVGYGIPLVVAVIAVLPTAWDREINSNTLGLRSFPLVSLGSCAYVLIAQAFADPSSDPDAYARLLQGLMGGIGFVGGGAILKNEDHVAGTASAASIWVTGALGAAAALRVWELVLLLSLLNLTIVYAFSHVRTRVDGMGTPADD